MNQERESLEFDIVFVGAGPANLASAIHLQRLLRERNAKAEHSIAIIDKGRYPGAHLLSGAVLDPVALREFMPDFLERGCPVESEVTDEKIWFLTKKRKFRFPLVPEAFRNSGTLLISLSRFGDWLAEEVSKEGIELFDNTAAVAPLIENGRLAGILLDDKGVDRNGRKKPGFEPGILLKAKAVVIGEGSDGSLLRQLRPLLSAAGETAPQRYSTGVKETWRVAEGRLSVGEVHHMFGYPLSPESYGGGWLYALSGTLLSVGFVSSPGPSSPDCDPHLNLQRLKQHPLLAGILEGGSMLESGARCISSGGLDSVGPLCGPGFLVTGESAGLVNTQRQKGLHLAIKSGILAAETLSEALLDNDFSDKRLKSYEKRFRESWAFDELHGARNYRKAFDRGLYAGLAHAGLQLAFPGLSLKAGEKGSAPKPGSVKEERERFTPDGRLTFSKEESLYRSGTMHEEDQPCHLLISEENIREICLKKCTEEFGNPCLRFCPAKVYELTDGAGRTLRINPSNCLHCKTCEVADPYSVITWSTPEGGGGPGYKLS